MDNRTAAEVLHGLRRLADTPAAQLTDGQLLARFATDRDEGAFALLLQRHGSLVYGVCRNVLRHEQDAEDAFQATFLVLARRARAIREQKALGSWLYRVAYRVAMKARAAAYRRQRREAQAAKSGEDHPVGDLAWRELQGMLDEELNRLPEKYRAPFVLCCLAGKSKAEAAAELGWKEGTVSSRLAQARERLRHRLARRGVALSAVLSGLAIAPPGTSAVVPAALLAATRKAAVAFAAGGRLAAAVAIAPVTLALAVLRGMTVARLKLPAAVLLLLGLAGAVTAIALGRGAPHPRGNTPSPPVAAAAPPLAPADELVRPAPAPRMTMAGVVLGPDGKKPFAGADVAVMVAAPAPPDDLYRPGRAGGQLLGKGRTDARGQYELSVPQTSQAYRRLSVWASAPGHAPFLRLVDPQEITNPKHEFVGDMAHQLLPGQTVRGRLLGPDARPAKGVSLLVLGMINERGSVHVVYYEPPVPLPGWPKDVVTDDDGIFTLRDIGPGTKVLLQVRDERYATNWLSVTTGNKERAKPIDLNLLPARTLVGRLTAEDTGKPLAHADVVVETPMPYPDPPYGAFPGSVTARTDEKGEFRVRPFPGERLEVFVYPAAGEPYSAVRHFRKWPAGASDHRFEFKVPRGIPLRGTVREQGTDRPVAGAAVMFRWGYRNNPYRVPTGDHKDMEWRHRDTVTDADGKFTMTVPPGPGLLMVKAAEPGFVPVETSSRQAEGGKGGGTPFFPDAFVPLQLRPTDAPAALSLQLRRGVTFRGRVVSSDGTPVKSAHLFSPRHIPEGIEFTGRHLVVRDGRFELPGCDPDGKVPVWVYDLQKREAAFGEFAVGGGDGPVIRLAPCTSGTVRVADGAGKPVRGAQLSLHLVLRPGEDANDSSDSGTPAEIYVPDVSLYKEDLQPTDAGDGTFPLRDLIPGATYAVQARTSSLRTEPITFIAPKTGGQNLGTLTLEPPVSRKKPGPPPAGRQPYIYEPRAVDPDDDPITFDLVQGPEGMTFDPQTGVLFWIPGPTQAGKHPVILRASDSYGRTAIQQFQINVSGPPKDPPPKK